MKELLSDAYAAMGNSEPFQAFMTRHQIEAQPVLTVSDDEAAHLIVEHLWDRIEGKTIIEIGGGIGLLALHMGFSAKRVFCIEANPFWSSSFIACLLAVKPKNVSYLFGAADEFVGQIKGDIALFCTHSGVESMKTVAGEFAPTVIDVYGELIASKPDIFDPVARALRGIV